MKALPDLVNVPLHAVNFGPVLQRRFADLLLIGVTVAALAALFRLTPTLGLVGWLYVLQHLIVVAIAITRPEPQVVDHSALSNFAVGVAYVCPYAQVICLYWWSSKVAWPEAGLVLVTTAAVFSVVCLLTIGNRFGVRPALRGGVATSGPYRLVRHPLYASYVVAAVGFNLQMWNLATLVLVLVGWAAMVCRILAEERVLSRDPVWRTYAASVHYRLIPGIW